MGRALLCAGNGDPEVSVGLIAYLKVAVTDLRGGSACGDDSEGARSAGLEGSLPVGGPVELEGDIVGSLDTSLSSIDDVEVRNDGLVCKIDGYLGISAVRDSSVEASLVDIKLSDVAGTEGLLGKIYHVFAASYWSVLGLVSSASVEDGVHLIIDSVRAYETIAGTAIREFRLGVLSILVACPRLAIVLVILFVSINAVVVATTDA